MISTFLTGMGTGGGLIIAIGAQNAFVLNQGIRREYLIMVPLICALSDVLLISAGVTGVGNLIQGHPEILKAATFGGSIFLFGYGLKSLISALINNEGLDKKTEKAHSRKQILLITLAITFLNPHVYLDTVLLLGSISSSFPGFGKYYFAAGAVSMSFLWFFSLSLGAFRLAPLFQNPRTWKILDSLIALMMWVIAYKLIAPEKILDISSNAN